MERRKFSRFKVELKVKARREGKESAFGKIKDFSRNGLRAIFDKFEFEANTPVELMIQRPNSDADIIAGAEPLWKKAVGDKCDVGFRLTSFTPEDKIDILEYGYFNWVREKKSAK